MRLNQAEWLLAKSAAVVLNCSPQEFVEFSISLTASTLFGPGGEVDPFLLRSMQTMMKEHRKGVTGEQNRPQEPRKGSKTAPTTPKAGSGRTEANRGFAQGVQIGRFRSDRPNVSAKPQVDKPRPGTGGVVGTIEGGPETEVPRGAANAAKAEEKQRSSEMAEAFKSAYGPKNAPEVKRRRIVAPPGRETPVSTERVFIAPKGEFEPVKRDQPGGKSTIKHNPFTPELLMPAVSKEAE